MPRTSTTAVEQAGDSLQSEDLIFDLAERRCEDYVTREMKKQAMPTCIFILGPSRKVATDTLRNLLRQRIFVIDALNVLVEHLEKVANSQLQIYRAQPSHVLDPPFGETAEQQAQSMVKRGIGIAIGLLMSRLAPLVGNHIDKYDWVKRVADEEAERMGQLVSEEFVRLRLEYQAQVELIDANRQQAATTEAGTAVETVVDKNRNEPLPNSRKEQGKASKVPADELEKIVENTCRVKADISIRYMAKRTGWSPGKIHGTAAWKNHMEKRKRNGAPRPGRVAFTKTMESTEGQEDEGFEQVDDRDELNRLIAEQEADGEPSPLDESGSNPKVHPRV